MTHRYHTLPWPSGLAQRDRALAQPDGMLCWRAPARDDRMKPNPARKYSAWPGLDKKLTCTPRPRPCKFTIPGDSCASVVFKRFRRASRPESFFALERATLLLFIDLLGEAPAKERCRSRLAFAARRASHCRCVLPSPVPSCPLACGPGAAAPGRADSECQCDERRVCR